MSISNDSFGFGSNVTGGSGTTTKVDSKQGLIDALTGSNLANKIVEIDEAKSGNYDFGGMGDGQSLAISAKSVTIRAAANAKPVLKNVQFKIEIDKSDNVLIQDLIFRSDGKPDHARDAILFNTTVPNANASGTNAVGLRVTHCSFDGYYDMSIEARGAEGRPRILATIDHCLFFDNHPGDPADSFYDRGGVNLAVALPVSDNEASAERKGNARVTVANNVFIRVWRRMPRVAQANVGHAFNNLLFQWGYTGDSTRPQTSWNATPVGSDETLGAKALIQANRFLPWDKKTDLNHAIAIDPGTSADINLDKGRPNLRPNRFDDPDGKPLAHDPDLKGPFSKLTAADLYSAESLPEPKVLAASDVNWTNTLDESGPRRTFDKDDPITNAKDHARSRVSAGS